MVDASEDGLMVPRTPSFWNVLTAVASVGSMALLGLWVFGYARCSAERAAPATAESVSGLTLSVSIGGDACTEVRAVCRAYGESDFVPMMLCRRLTIRAWEKRGGGPATVEDCGAALSAIRRYESDGPTALAGNDWKW